MALRDEHGGCGGGWGGLSCMHGAGIGPISFFREALMSFFDTIKRVGDVADARSRTGSDVVADGLNALLKPAGQRDIYDQAALTKARDNGILFDPFEWGK